MNFCWTIDQADLDSVKIFVSTYQSNPFVQVRAVRNLRQLKQPVGRLEFWKQMVAARMSSVQRSGANSAVLKLLRTNPFPLSYDQVASLVDVDGPRDLIASTIRSHGGIRFPNKIAEDLSNNLDKLNVGNGWVTTLQKVNSLVVPADARKEREVARFLQQLLHGFGPKQSRNLLQSLGLTRYEIPIDSRITKWLRNFDFPVVLNAATLADAEYYEFVLDAVQALCARSGIFPCILDAAIFASFDGGEWTKENVIY